MKKKGKIKASILGISVFMPMVLAGCGQSNSLNKEPESLKLENVKTSETSNGATENINREVVLSEEEGVAIEDNKNDLAGTCPKGLHCGAPGKCGLFIDQNNNDLCDRGEEK